MWIFSFSYIYYLPTRFARRGITNFIQATTLNNNITTSTIILGNFNLDLNKENDGSYGKRLLFDDMIESLGHHNLEQMIQEDTWSRIINGNLTSSRIDHVHTTCQDNLQRMQYSNEAYSDHLLIKFNLTTNENIQPTKPTYKRSWYGYNKEKLCAELETLNWDCNREDPQSYYDWFENEILKVVDHLVPYKAKMYNMQTKKIHKYTTYHLLIEINITDNRHFALAYLLG